jgi:hypothetical protein
MEVDLILASLLILLGSMLAYVLDEHFGFTARVSDWISKSLGEY